MIQAIGVMLCGAGIFIILFNTRQRLVPYLLGAGILLLLTGMALAHDAGESNWIEQNGYVGTDNIKCCGPNDCERIADAEIEVRRDGFWLKQFAELVPFSEATPSEARHLFDMWRRISRRGRFPPRT